ncbi:MAG: sulfatase-like hydrolase/transferase [Labilithrix sp.]|nr:sulfatase-like hydrolase/transferase [Labilithrix sp.]
MLPGRIAIARHQAQLGYSALEVTIAGTLRDVSDLARPVGVLMLLVLAGALFVRHARAMRVLLPALAVLAVLVWFTSAAAAEFKVQRGVDATWFDVQIATHASTPGGTFIGFLKCRRHYVPALLISSAVAALVLVARRRARSWPMENQLAVLGGFAGATTLGWLLALAPLDPHVRVFRTVSDRHIVGEPFVNLFSSFGRSQENVRLGMRGLIETTTFAPAPEGAAIVGLPAAAGSIRCSSHPFARSFVEDGAEPPREGANGHRPLAPEAARVLRLLDRISAELYEGRALPIDVWQVMLESFRGDDVHALEPTAPRDVAPFMNGLYEAAARGDGTVIAVRNMWQAGARTSQGLSAYLCGLGTMPYGLSVARDFGSIPLRCLPDLLADAKLEGSFWYGGNPSFDDMDPFLRRHGIAEVTGAMQLPRDAPIGQEGVTDRAVYAHAADRVLASAPEHARYTLVMSASNHIPYMRPDDVTPEVEARAAALRSSPSFIGSNDDAARVRTFAYADHALGELVDRLRPRHDRTIFVLGADHSTGDPFTWRNPSRNVEAAHARIPFAILLPEPLVANAARPDALRALVRELDAALDGHAWSQNDVPLFVLTLLSHAPGMRALPPERRWHTLGGERTSPYWRAPADAHAIGIDAVANFYGVDDDARSLLPAEKASFVRDASEITTSCPSLRPVAAALSTFLRGHVARCNDRDAIQAER